jgi:protein-L-isoaspartate(D-aspartate) O-methyltransferase
MINNKDLVESLEDSGVLKSENIKKAFLNIDRKDFVTEEYKDLAYMDTALPIGYEQTISQPYTVVFMLELLDLKQGQNVLDIGSGSGWSTALLSKIVGKEGTVHALELIEDLVQMGRENIAKYNIVNASISKAKEELGMPGEVFDRILVSAAADEFPEELLGQLKENGIIVIPIKDSIFKFKKVSGKEIEKEEYFGFSFVELK